MSGAPTRNRGTVCFCGALTPRLRPLSLTRVQRLGRRPRAAAGRGRIASCTAASEEGDDLHRTGPLYGALVAAQLIPFVFPHSGVVGDVAYFSTTAVAALMIGCARAQRETAVATAVSRRSALAAPFVASAVLFGSYVLLKYTQLDVAAAFNALTTLAGALCLKEALDPPAAALLARLGVQPRVGEGLGAEQDAAPPPSSWLAGAAAVGVAGCYLLGLAPTFVFSNAIAIGIAARALSLVRAESFAVAATLLVALCAYDLYFVFGSDVMVTVATQIDSPGKLLFPREVTGEGYPFAVLGLGDICVPGVFVNLAATVGEVTGGPYFNMAVLAYLAGLLSCFGVNMLTKAPQPALVYLVPALLGSTLATAAAREELPLVLSFQCKKEGKSEEGTDTEEM